MDKRQIRTIFLFQYRLGRKATETARDINEAFGPGTTSLHTVQRWFKKFRSGDESLEDDERSGRPSNVNEVRLRVLIEANPRSSTRELAKELGISSTSVSKHLQQIGKVKKHGKWT